MELSKRVKLSFIAIALLAHASYADEMIKNSSGSQELEGITITEKSDVTQMSDSYTTPRMSTATKMSLSPLETPQSTSVVTAQQMEDFNLKTINRALESTTGVTVEKMESDRTLFTSRGFGITNILEDGVNLPLTYDYQYGDIDMSLYDRIEITRGATGLSSNHGDPSATVNLIRKRPTAQTEAEGKISYSSWDTKRIDTDVSGALNDSKSIRGRVIAAKESGDSYLDRYSSDSTIVSGMIEADVMNDSLLTFGATRYSDKNNGTQWGGIPAFDGKNYPVSTNAASDWSYRDVQTTEFFTEFTTPLSNRWNLKTTYKYKDTQQDAELINLWVYSGILKIDGLQDYTLDTKEHLFDITLDGKYDLFGREHEAVMGINIAKRDAKERSDYDLTNTGTVIDLSTWDGSTVTPVYDDRTLLAKWKEEQKAAFIATNYHLTDQLSFLAGTKVSNFEKRGYGYWDSDVTSKNSGVWTPYASLLYKFTDNISSYVSYTTSFTPQSFLDKDGQYIDPKEGKNLEFGVKSSWFDSALNTSFALFKTSQDNVASYAGTLSDGTGRSYYTLEDGVITKGFEMEVAGKLTQQINASIGYTKLSIEDSEGAETQTYIPTETLKAMLTYSPINALKLGAAIRWQNDTYIKLGYGSAQQEAYSIVDLMASYQFTKNLKASLYVDNVGDKKYYGSLIKPYVNYGEPRNVGVTLAYTY